MDKEIFPLSKKTQIFQTLAIVVNTFMVVKVCSKPYHSNEIQRDPLGQSDNMETSDKFQGMIDNLFDKFQGMIDNLFDICSK